MLLTLQKSVETAASIPYIAVHKFGLMARIDAVWHRYKFIGTERPIDPDRLAD
jgi:hypothetical protein